MNEPIEIDLALDGGGALGAYTWGVIDALLQDGRYKIRNIVGYSAGGMNAVALADGIVQGKAREVPRQLWQNTQAMAVPALAFESQLRAVGLGDSESGITRAMMEKSWSNQTYSNHGLGVSRDAAGSLPFMSAWHSDDLFADVTFNPIIQGLRKTVPNGKKTLLDALAPRVVVSAVDILTNKRVLIENKSLTGSPNKDFSLTAFAGTGALYPYIPAVSAVVNGKRCLLVDGVYDPNPMPWDALPETDPRPVLFVDLDPDNHPMGPVTSASHDANMDRVLHRHIAAPPQRVPEDKFTIHHLRYEVSRSFARDRARATQTMIDTSFEAGRKAYQLWLAEGGFGMTKKRAQAYRPLPSIRSRYAQPAA